MLFNLLYPLVPFFSPFNVVQYITFRGAIAAVFALLLSLLLGPWTIKQLRLLKARQTIRDEGPQTHLSKAGTPTMGGILMIVSIVISGILWMDLNSVYTWQVIVGTLAFGAIGFVDDFLKITQKNSQGLMGPKKMFWQVVVSLLLMVWIYLTRNSQTTYLYLPFFKFPILDLGLFYIPLGVFLMVGFSNAVNLTDGLDGLATGLLILSGITLAILTYVSGHAEFSRYLLIPFIPGAGELTIYCAALVGASVGFLWFNSHPAEVFMGDTGPLAFGGVIAMISMLVKKEVLLLIFGGVFVIEALSVMIQVFWFKRTGKRIFRMSPLHHHFELSGWSETKVVIRFWILGGLLTLLSLSTLKLQ
jgi:phospho-N-acetylmuramoyl-pentapeptide-transferase